jgi:hypothetical protein
MFDFTSDGIRNFIDENGKLLKGKKSEIEKSIAKAEEITEHLLGCTLIVGDKKYILSMLELYYGGVGDPAHDWFKKSFRAKKKNLVMIKQTEVQKRKGLRIYLSSPKINHANRHQRFDIVIGPANVAISVLVRGVLDISNSTPERIGARNGSPNTVLHALKINSKHHDQIIHLSESSKFRLIDTHSKYVKMEGDVHRQLRINLCNCFENKYSMKWNYSLSEYHKPIKRKNTIGKKIRTH